MPINESLSISYPFVSCEMCVYMKHLLELNIEMFLKLLLFPCYSWILTIVVWIHTHTYLSWEIRHQRDFSNDHYYCERHQKYFLSVLWSDYCVRVCVCVQLHWKYKEFKINCTQTETHTVFLIDFYHTGTRWLFFYSFYDLHSFGSHNDSSFFLSCLKIH